MEIHCRYPCNIEAEEYAKESSEVRTIVPAFRGSLILGNCIHNIHTIVIIVIVIFCLVIKKTCPLLGQCQVLIVLGMTTGHTASTHIEIVVFLQL